MTTETTLQRLILTAFRLMVGWVFLGAALRQIPDASWSAVGFLGGAPYYSLLTQPPLINIIDTLVPWVHLLLGLALILGVFMRLTALVGSVLMILYLLPRIAFPAVFTDAHIIYSLLMIYLASVGAGRFFGLQGWIDGFKPLERHPTMRAVLG
jgi:thiosulfate dehydrogenase [quinone] large subunit